MIRWNYIVINFLPEAIIFALMQKRCKKIKAAVNLYPPFL